MDRRSIYAILTAAVVVVVLIASPLHLRQVIWTGIVLAVLAVSIIVVAGAINILSVLWSMYRGYEPTAEERQGMSPRTEAPSALVPFACPSGNSDSGEAHTRIREASKATAHEKMAS